jgi:hypothetical protein
VRVCVTLGLRSVVWGRGKARCEKHAGSEGVVYGAENNGLSVL